MAELVNLDVSSDAAAAGLRACETSGSVVEAAAWLSEWRRSPAGSALAQVAVQGQGLGEHQEVLSGERELKPQACGPVHPWRPYVNHDDVRL